MKEPGVEKIRKKKRKIVKDIAFKDVAVKHTSGDGKHSDKQFSRCHSIVIVL